MNLGFKGSIAFLLFVGLAILGLQNLEEVPLRFLLWNVIEIPKVYLIFSVAFIGYLIGLIMGWRAKSNRVEKSLAKTKNQENDSAKKIEAVKKSAEIDSTVTH